LAQTIGLYDDIRSRSATPLPSATLPAEEQANLPVIIAVSAGGVILLLFSVLLAVLWIRRKNKREKVLLRGPPPKVSPSVGRAIGDNPLCYASTTESVVDGSQPALSKSYHLPSPVPRSTPPLQVVVSKPLRPTAIYERSPSLYTESALEQAYETLERNAASPVPSYISGFTDGALSRPASARPSSDLNHGLTFRSVDRPPSRSNAKLLFPQAFDAQNSERPGTSGSTRSRPGTSGSTRSRSRYGGEQIVSVVRKPSEVRRTELLTALSSTDSVTVVGRPGLPSRPTTASRLSTVGELQQPEIDTGHHEITEQDITNAHDRFVSLSEKSLV
jgi:hypothetical protein